MVEMARVVSVEGGALVERQTSALFGDIKRLSLQMQEAVGTEIESAEELMARVANAIEKEKVRSAMRWFAASGRLLCGVYLVQCSAIPLAPSQFDCVSNNEIFTLVMHLKDLNGEP